MVTVDARSLTFGYSNEDPVLADISFSLDASKILAIVGASGSGKSTLLRLICGLLPSSPSQPFSGSVHINGVGISTPGWKELRATGTLGFMFQEPCLLPNMTLEENIHLPLRILGQTVMGGEVLSDYLSRTGLEKEKHKFSSQSSGGMKTRAALARTFISGPKLLLLDEPFSALDIVWKTKLYGELRRLRNELGSTVILVTHDIFEAIYFSDRILVMGAGRSIHEVSIPNWNALHSYNDVIHCHHQDFIRIRQIIQSPPAGPQL